MFKILSFRSRKKRTRPEVCVTRTLCQGLFLTYSTASVIPDKIMIRILSVFVFNSSSIDILIKLVFFFLTAGSVGGNRAAKRAAARRARKASKQANMFSYLWMSFIYSLRFFFMAFSLTATQNGGHRADGQGPPNGDDCRGGRCRQRGARHQHGQRLFQCFFLSRFHLVQVVEGSESLDMFMDMSNPYNKTVHAALQTVAEDMKNRLLEKGIEAFSSRNS